MPRRFVGADPLQRPQIFVPLATEPVVNRERSLTAFGHHAWWLTVMGRLQPGIALEKANAEIASISDVVLCERVPRCEVDREPRETPLQICCGARIGGIQLRSHELPQAAGRGVRHVRRDSFAGVPQPCQPAAGARYRTPEGTGYTHGDGGLPAKAHPAVAGRGTLLLGFNRNDGWPCDCADGEQVARCNAAERR